MIINPTGINRELFDLDGSGVRTLAAANGLVDGDTRLTKTPNDPTDIGSVFESNASFTKILAPEGMTDVDFELALEDAFDAYEDGILNYNNFDFNLSGRNSNAFASGLLAAAGVPKSVIGTIDKGGRFTPGLPNPIPRKFFKRREPDEEPRH